MRRRFVAVLSLGCSVAATIAVPARADRAPDVLLLTIDTLRPDYLSVNGYDRPTSPVLDALILSGWYFEDAASPIGRTTPALASLLTGAYPHSTRVRALWENMPPEVVTLPQVLRAAGWRTLAVVTNNVLTTDRGLDRGFDIYDTAEDSRPARVTTDKAIEQLARIPKDQPLFAWVHYIDPHVPYRSDPKIIQSFDPGYRSRYPLAFGWTPLPGEPAGPVKPFPDDLPKVDATHRNHLPENVVAHIRRLYAADIRSADDEIGRLLAAFRARSGKNLLVVFAADHGESLGEHAYFFDHGDYCYEGEIRVPLAFSLPPSSRFAGKGYLSGRVSLVDVAPTLLELLSVKASPEFASRLEGRSLVPFLQGDSPPERPVFGESGHAFYPEVVTRRVRNDVEGAFRCVVLGDWKLIWTPFQTGALEWELYDLRKDPHETHDLWRADQPHFQELKPILLEWAKAGKWKDEPSPIAERDLEKLRSLGYIK
ncbi:MAG: sulfatase [bacterium]